MSRVMLLPPKGNTVRKRRMLFLYTEMVVVSAPKSINAQPERRSLSVSTALAVTSGAISWSAMSIFACWKQCSRFLRTEARATMLRKRPSMWLPTRPTGLACRLLPTLYSCGATSNISISTTGMAMFSSPIALTSSSDMMASSSRSRLTTLRTVRSDCPPMPTYTLAIEFFNSPSSLLMIEVRLCAVLSRLKITPLRINVEESSWAYANTCILPSLFFLPATPVIFDEPSSIAAINSVVAIYIYLRFYDLQFTIEKRLFTPHLSTINYQLSFIIYSRLVQIIWLLNSRLIREYLFQPTRLSPFL